MSQTQISRIADVQKFVQEQQKQGASLNVSQRTEITNPQKPYGIIK